MREAVTVAGYLLGIVLCFAAIAGMLGHDPFGFPFLVYLGLAFLVISEADRRAGR